MTHPYRLILPLLLAVSSSSLATETIVFFRHGEKPGDTSGQLSCQGLNRALALPQVLLSRFGTPGALFAAAPDTRIGGSVRPLSTIIPLAVRLTMPVNIQYHSGDIKPAANALLNDKQALTLVAWEHNNLVKIAKTVIYSAGGDPSLVPDTWPDKDFDSLYVVTINNAVTPHQVTFSHQYQGLNNLPDLCR